ncbi:MAG: YtxH domain-containing protein [Patescibacteria group bacterium]
MNLFSRKSTFIIGSLIGSVVGLLFAREAGQNLRAKLKEAKTPQKKFEALFREYLKAGKSAIEEAKKSGSVRDLMQGGKEILAELQKKAQKEGGSAVKFAQKKAAEVLKEMEKQAGGAKKIIKKEVVKKTATAKKAVRKVARKLKPKKLAKKKPARRAAKKK